jgi:hypothetical protein
VAWGRFDDRYDDNRKVKRAWRANRGAIGLHAMAITYSSRHETDGLIDLDWLIEKVPAARERERVVRVLVEAGLFEALDGEMFMVHDYLEFNPSAADLQAKRERDAARKRAKSPDGFHADSTRTPNGFHGGATQPRAGAPAEIARPVPARPGTTEGQA